MELYNGKTNAYRLDFYLKERLITTMKTITIGCILFLVTMKTHDIGLYLEGLIHIKIAEN